MILVGDLCQLPPIPNTLLVPSKMLDPDFLKEGRAVQFLTPRRKQEFFLNRGMIFQSRAFWDLGLRFIELTTQHRQHDDADLAWILQRLRLGPDEQAIRELNDRCYHPLEEPSTDSVALLPTVKDVNLFNAQRLDAINAKSVEFTARDKVEPCSVPEDRHRTPEEASTAFKDRKKALEKSSFFKDGDSSCPADSRRS